MDVPVLTGTMHCGVRTVKRECPVVNRVLSRVVFVSLLMVLAMPLPVWAVDCSQHGYALYSQDEVDDFQATYGNGNVCDRLPGGLIVSGNDITNLDGLKDITSIEEGLSLSSVHFLTNVNGLENLTQIGGSLRITGKHNLTNIDGLRNLTDFDGFVYIRGNFSLANIDGLAGLSKLITGIEIWDNQSLRNIDGLRNITGIEGGLNIRGNLLLENINGLESLTRVGEQLYISGNDSLTNIDGLSSLTSIGSDLFVSANYALERCEGVSRLLDQWDDAEPGPGPGIGGFPDIGGVVTLQSNLAGCNSIQEVLAGANTSNINAGLNDAWYNPETSGQGFFITVFPDLRAVSLAWFTYDTELPPDDAQANLGDAGHRWLTGVGMIDGNQVVMNIEMTSGGLFDTATEIQRTDPPGSDGTIILTFDSCNSGSVEYDIPSINRQGIIPIQRVASDNIALCEALNAE